MKRLITFASAAMLLSGYGAAAQSIVDMPSRGSPRHEREADWRRDSWRDEQQPFERKGWRAETSSERPSVSRPGHFSIEDGQSKIDLRCPDGEALRECAQVLMEVIDHMRGSNPEDEAPRERGGDRRHQEEGS